MGRALQIAGQRFGRLLAIEPAYRGVDGRLLWRFRCDCGKEHFALAKSVAGGLTKSCGCLYLEARAAHIAAVTKHGQAKTRTWCIWQGMLQRCGNPNNGAYNDYGARGITVCPEWQTFEGFFASMGHAPAGHSIERCDNDGPYASGNCKWATRVEQNSNTRSNVYVEIDGETRTATAWARHYGINPKSLQQRLRKGESAEVVIQRLVARTRKAAVVLRPKPSAWEE